MRLFAYALATAASLGLAIPAVHAAPVPKKCTAVCVSAQPTADQFSAGKKKAKKKETTGSSAWGG
jgi:hypothetical protein